MNTTGIFFRFPFIPYFCQLCIPWHDSYPYDMCLLIRYGSNVKGFRKVSNQVAAAVAWFNFVAKEMQKSKNLYIITLFPDMHQLFLYVWYIRIYIYIWRAYYTAPYFTHLFACYVFCGILMNFMSCCRGKTMISAGPFWSCEIHGKQNKKWRKVQKVRQKP